MDVYDVIKYSASKCKFVHQTDLLVYYWSLLIPLLLNEEYD